ncbi:MAG TPA: hypothetical protein VMS93_00390 [Candidatus Saccharimonadales bacterium]|nr:hypothetical protein [Candidatus Saccharimonadales bacterium]
MRSTVIALSIPVLLTGCLAARVHQGAYVVATVRLATAQGDSAQLSLDSRSLHPRPFGRYYLRATCMAPLTPTQPVCDCVRITVSDSPEPSHGTSIWRMLRPGDTLDTLGLSLRLVDFDDHYVSGTSAWWGEGSGLGR